MCTGQDGKNGACLGPATAQGPGQTIVVVCILATLTVALEGGGGQGRATWEGNCPERRDAGPLCGERWRDAVVHFLTLIAIRCTGDSRNVFIHHRWFGKMIN